MLFVDNKYKNKNALKKNFNQISILEKKKKHKLLIECQWRDLNSRPQRYECCALTG